jgi:hypothetical protein
MARRSDPDTSKQAARTIVRRAPGLLQRVYAAFVTRGPMTAKDAEQLPEFAAFGFSTVRKRVSELHRKGYLRNTGRIESGCTVYEVVDGAAPLAPGERIGP